MFEKMPFLNSPRKKGERQIFNRKRFIHPREKLFKLLLAFVNCFL